MYRLASSPNDYKLCHALARSTSLEDRRLEYPTIMGIDDDILIGFVSTMQKGGLLAVGQMAVKKGRLRSVVAGKLLTALENVLRLSGVSWYYIPVQRDRDDLMELVSGFAERLDDTDDGNAWFKRKIDVQSRRELSGADSRG
ncbi:hypothetical protein LCGC14_3032610, partial [marine sediment metagenome]